ncbi:MAG: DUF4270 domain-containing protein [Chitinophagales bacterium]|nr:DUF4270 domain-containing protein [Chitinophagales bacterium]MDW8418558.1 DUF4270 domain-containing protein [Chitinophagales bacterium]
MPACKDPLIEDTGLLGEGDELLLDKDTLTARAYSYFMPAVKANGVAVGALGSIEDPSFGKVFASFYAQCRISAGRIQFGSGATLDSVVLRLRYNGLYGNNSTPIDIYVYELDESMQEGTTYLSNQSFSVKLPPIGSVQGFVPNTTDSAYVYGVKIAPHLRIPLSSGLGNKILHADTSQLKDNNSFLQIFKGFYITTSSQTTGNGIMYLDLISSISGITLYYHNSEADSLLFYLPVSGVTVNHFDNVYTGYPVNTSVINPQPNGEQKLYLQGGAGVYGKVFFPGIDSLPRNILINKAELILTQSVSDTVYPTPQQLSLLRIDDAGNEQILEDDGSSSFGGKREVVTVNGVALARYRFNLRRYFQRLVQGVHKNNGFIVKTLTPHTNTERVAIANNPALSNQQINLYITYTKM